MSHLAAIPYLDRPSDTNTSQIAEKGALRIHKHGTFGMQVCRMVKNTSGATIVSRRVVMYKDGSAEEVLYSAAAEPKVNIAGVSIVDIPNNSYGWVVCSGVTSVKTNASAVTLANPVSTIATAGEVTDTAVTGIEHCQIGVALSAVGAGGGFVNVGLSGLM